MADADGLPAGIRRWLLAQNPDALFADGLDAALYGALFRPGQPVVAVYDIDQIVAILSRDMGKDDAQEYFDFNIEGAYCGPHTPVFLRPRWDLPGASDEA